MSNYIAQLSVRHDIRLDLVPDLGPLLKGVGEPNQTGFAPGFS